MNEMMKTNRTARARKAAFATGGGFLIALTLAGCTTAGEDRYGDRRRCYDYGSRHQNGCMYRQQHRRDREQLINQEKALINAQHPRENLRMLREIRRWRGEE
jgi:hypothetical protein